MVEAKIDTDKKIFFVVVLLLLVFGIYKSYAYFSAKSKTSTETVTTAKLSVDVQNNGIINKDNIIPIDSDDMQTKATKLDFTINNTGTIDFTSKVNLNILEINDELRSNDFKWSLYEDDIEVAKGTFLTDENSITLTDEIDVAKEKNRTFTLYIWIEDTGIPQDILQGRNFTGQIEVNAIQ